MNGDGNNDLVVANAPEQLLERVARPAVTAGKGDGTFQAAVIYGTGGHGSLFRGGGRFER